MRGLKGSVPFLLFLVVLLFGCGGSKPTEPTGGGNNQGGGTQLVIPKLYINEFMASNRKTLADEYGEYDDWIEIYNDEDKDVRLLGLYLTDNLRIPDKWPFPDATIKAKGFIIVWADGTPDQGIMHASFKLSKTGEEIGLVASDGKTVIDSVKFRTQQPDISFGRYPDGGIDWFECIPTPGKPNRRR
jgi:hypothetical protein